MKYKVTYTQILHTGEEQQHTTEIEYKSEEEAQKYADQLNTGKSYKNAKVIPASYTRAEYLEGKCTHAQYYEQFLSAGIISHVCDVIGREKIQKSEDPAFNDIALSRWDGCAESLRSMTFGIGERMRRAGDSPTLMGWVCICKAAARVYKNNNQ